MGLQKMTVFCSPVKMNRTKKQKTKHNKKRAPRTAKSFEGFPIDFPSLWRALKHTGDSPSHRLRQKRLGSGSRVPQWLPNKKDTRPSPKAMGAWMASNSQALSKVTSENVQNQSSGTPQPFAGWELGPAPYGQATKSCLSRCSPM